MLVLTKKESFSLIPKSGNVQSRHIVALLEGTNLFPALQPPPNHPYFSCPWSPSLIYSGLIFSQPSGINLNIILQWRLLWLTIHVKFPLLLPPLFFSFLVFITICHYTMSVPLAPPRRQGLWMFHSLVPRVPHGAGRNYMCSEQLLKSCIANSHWARTVPDCLLSFPSSLKVQTLLGRLLVLFHRWINQGKEVKL